MLTLGIVAFALCFLIASANRATRTHFYCATFALASFGVHKTLFQLTSVNTGHVGIASGAPSVAVSTLCVLVLAVPALLSRPRGLGFSLTLPFLLYLAFGMTVLWPSTPLTSAGAWHLAIAALGLCAGAQLARSTESPSEIRILAIWVATVLSAQTLIACLQVLGFPIFYNPELLQTDPTLAGRATGTFFHPSTLGKVSVLAAVIALPLLASKRPGDRRLAWLILGSGFLSCMLTAGRANAMALVGTCVLWILLSSPKIVQSGLKFRVGLALLVGALVTSPHWNDRFMSGESGQRSHFTAVALSYLDANSWWSGVGPNAYVEAVGQADALTATGWPVHNIFLLTTVELGLIGMLLFVALFAVPVWNAWGVRRVAGMRSAFAVALLAVAPGMLVIVWTGWGMLSDCLVPWTMVTGFCYWKSRFSSLDLSTEVTGTPTTPVKRPSGPPLLK